MEPREFSLGGKPLVFCMFPVGTELVPNATLSGMDCLRSSGAQRRWWPATDSHGGSCLQSRHYCWGLCAVGRAGCRLLCGRLRRFYGWHLANAKGRRNLLRLWRLQELLKVTILGEDIAKRLLHDIIGAGMDVSGVLIDLRCSRVRQPNRGADLFGLDDFE